jgi:hypothetical protein
LLMTRHTEPPTEPPPGAVVVPDDNVVSIKNGRGQARMIRYEWEPLATNQSWLIKNRMMRTGVGALIGRGYTGKTQALIDLAAAVICERPWGGGRVMRPGGVIYFSAEGGLGVLRSWAALKDLVIGPWYAHQGLVMPSEFPFALVIEMPTLLPNKDGAVKWYSDRIHEAQAVFEKKFSCPTPLAIFDTFAKIAGFKDENDNVECTDAFKTLDRIAQANDVFCITSDHLPKDEDAKKARGGSAKFDAADSIFRIGVGDGDARVLHVDKVRDGEGGQEIAFKLSVVKRGVDDDGDDITSVRLTWSEGSQHILRDGPGRKSRRLPDMLLAISDCYDADFGKHVVIAGASVYAVPGAECRRNYFRRAGGAGQSEMTLQTNYTNVIKKLKSSGVIDTYRFDTGEEYVWRVAADEIR